MTDRTMHLARLAAIACVIGACAKANTAADTATPAAAAAPTDHSADERTILATDSGWIRNVMAKNVDSLMTYYAADAVSYGFGAPAVGIDQIRTSYTNMVKMTVTDPKLLSNTIKFSNDGSMAYDHGTYTMTMTPPGGKASTETGAYLNVWKKFDGQWKLVAEASTPVPPPPPAKK
jgi:uncharacterized protein (TIGR02246 family)